MPQSNLWSKDFVIAFVTFFFFSVTFWLLMPTMAVYATERFGASQDRAGLVAGLFIIGALVSRLLAGRYIERVGRSTMVQASLLVSLVATLLYIPANDLALLSAVRFIHGTAFGVITTALPTIVVDIIPSHRRGEGIGYFSLAPTMASAIGPFLGLFIVAQAGFRVLFVVCAALSVLSIAMALCLRIPAAAADPANAKGFAWHELFERSALPVSIVMLLVGTAFSGIITFLNSFSKEIGVIGVAGPFFAVYSAFILMSRPLAGRLQDVRGDNIVIYPALMVFALSLALLGVADRQSVLLVAAALAGLGFGVTFSSAQTIAVKEAPAQHCGRATATFLFCFDAGVGGGPFLIGSIIPWLGFHRTYMTLAGVVVASIFLYHRMHGSKQRRQR